MYAGNVSANYLKRNLLDSPQERKMKLTDLFMHWDDLCLCASFYTGEQETIIVDGVATKVSPTFAQKATACFSRMLPIAMLMAGYQVGCKGLERVPSRKKQMHHDIKNDYCQDAIDRKSKKAGTY